MNKLTVTVTRQSKSEAKCIAALPPLLQQKMRHVCAMYAAKLFVCLCAPCMHDAAFLNGLRPQVQMGLWRWKLRCRLHFLREDLWQKVLAENSQSLPPFIEAELEIVFPGPYKVTTPISSCIFEAHVTIPPPRLALFMCWGSLRLLASKMSLAAKGAGELVCPVRLVEQIPKDRNWQKTMMILNYIQVYSI